MKLIGMEVMNNNEPIFNNKKKQCEDCKVLLGMQEELIRNSQEKLKENLDIRYKLMNKEKANNFLKCVTAIVVVLFLCLRVNIR